MNDFEQQLRSVPLAAPSPELDRRLEQAFARAADRSRVEVTRRPRWFALSAAGIVASVVAVQLFRFPQPLIRPGAGAPVVHWVEADLRLRELLLEMPAKSPPLPRLNASVVVVGE